MKIRLVFAMVLMAGLLQMAQGTAAAQTGPKYWAAFDYCNQHRNLSLSMYDDPACQEFVRRGKMADTALKGIEAGTAAQGIRNSVRRGELERQWQGQQRSSDHNAWYFNSQASQYEQAAQRAAAAGDFAAAQNYLGWAQWSRDQAAWYR